MLTSKSFDVKSSLSHGKVFACRSCVDYGELLHLVKNNEEHVMWDLCKDCYTDEPEMYQAKIDNFIKVYQTIEDHYGFVPMDRMLFLLYEDDCIYWEPEDIIDIMFMKGYIHLEFNNVCHLSFTDKGVRHFNILCDESIPVL